MPGFGAPELIIILVIVLVLFGVGRLGRIGGELGKGIFEFRKGLSGGNDPNAKRDETKDETKPPA